VVDPISSPLSARCTQNLSLNQRAPKADRKSSAAIVLAMTCDEARSMNRISFELVASPSVKGKFCCPNGGLVGVRPCHVALQNQRIRIVSPWRPYTSNARNQPGPMQSLFLERTTCPASDLLYRDRECRQCGRQEPGPIVEKADSDGRHETARQETDEQTQRLFQMIGIGLVQCAAAF